jgi:hypothetical protein
MEENKLKLGIIDNACKFFNMQIATRSLTIQNKFTEAQECFKNCHEYAELPDKKLEKARKCRKAKICKKIQQKGKKMQGNRTVKSPFAELFPQLRPQTVANHQPEHGDR